jgi:hypothetical protein
MGKDNHKGPYFLVPIPYAPQDEKEADTSDGKPPSVKLLLDSEGKNIDDPTVQVQPIFNGGTTKQFFKWSQSLRSILEGQTVGEHFCLALQALRGTDKAPCQREMDLMIPKLAESAGLSLEASEKLWYDSTMKLTIHVLEDPRAGFKKKDTWSDSYSLASIPVFEYLWIVSTSSRHTGLFFHLRRVKY